MIFDKTVKILEKETANFTIPSVTSLSENTISPFLILVSTLLSLRTKDEITLKVSLELFEKVQTPQQMLEIDIKTLEKIIFKTGFYHNKAKTLKSVSKTLIEKFNGRVPETLEELLSIKGVGRKTANLVLIKAFDKYGICVDTHVHRISNRLGWVKTKNADETELQLREILPLKYWKIINDLLVKYGQNICRPINPDCDNCKITWCPSKKNKKSAGKN